MRLFILAFLASAALVSAQDTDNILSKVQVHGNLTQGFLFSSGNSYLTTDSENGSFKWTEGVLNATLPISDHLHVAAQIDSLSLGELDRQKVTLDFAFADYKFNQYFGIRAGRTKTPIGLFNDTQDIDAVQPFALLPESLYPADMRSFHLSHDGLIGYGEVGLPKKLGSVTYQAFIGARTQNPNEGFAYALNESGTAIGPTSGLSSGADVRWTLPIPGWFVGASYMKTDLKAPHSETLGVPNLGAEFRYTTYDFYTQYQYKNLTLSGEWNIEPSEDNLDMPVFHYTPSRIWYVMGDYRINSKLSAGAYYASDYSFDGNRNRQDPANYSKETVVSTRIDLNQYFYAKLEGHYIIGETDGLYNIYNPNGFQKDTRLAVARVGFVF